MAMSMMSSMLTILALAVVAVPAQAQGESEQAELAANCRLAAHVLITGQPAPHRRWALEQIGACSETGGEALAAVWRDAPTDSMTLVRLVFASSRFRDQRVVDAVLQTALDPSRAFEVRMAALRVVPAFVDPSAYVPSRVLLSPPSSAVLGARTDVELVSGSMPLRADVATTVRAALDTIGSQDADVRIRRAAAYLSEAVAERLRTLGQ